MQKSMVLPPEGTADWTWHWLCDDAERPFVAQFRSETCLHNPGLARWFFSVRDTGLWAIDLSRRGWRYVGLVEHPSASSKPAPCSWRRPNWQDIDKWRLVVSDLSGPVMAFNHRGEWYLGDGRTLYSSAITIVEFVQEFAVPDEILVCSEKQDKKLHAKMVS